jgi:hypothetical protein
LHALGFQAEQGGIREERLSEPADPVRAPVHDPVRLLETAGMEVAGDGDVLASEDLLHVDGARKSREVRFEIGQGLLETRARVELGELRRSTELPPRLETRVASPQVREPIEEAQVERVEEVDVARYERRTSSLNEPSTGLNRKVAKK